MESYLTMVLLSWLPLLGLTVVLLLHSKVEIPILKGIFGTGARCMDKRVSEEGWQLPGGAYALGLPIIWGGVTYFTFVSGWEGVAKFLAAFVLYQFYFSSPLFAIGLLKVFLHGLFSDGTEFPVEMHSQVCKAVAVTDPVGMVIFFIGRVIPGDEPLELLFDGLTALHLIDVLPFVILGNVVGNAGRMVRRFVRGGQGPWLWIRLGFSTMS